MKGCIGICLWAGWLASAMLAGCAGSAQVVSVRDFRPARTEIPAAVKRIAVVRFSGQTRDERQWGPIAAGKLTAALRSMAPHKPYDVSGPDELQKMADAGGLMPVIDTATAQRLGELAGADAVVYGTVRVACRDEQAAGPRAVRRCAVTVSFTMDRVATGRSIVHLQHTAQHDPASDSGGGKSPGGLKAAAAGVDKPIAASEIIDRLIGRCVQAFISEISPHDKRIPVVLARGGHRIVHKGNRLAAVGDWDEALACYQTAIAQNPGDHGALFNAGVVYEVLGRFGQAEKMYARAAAGDGRQRYVVAKNRVGSKIKR